MNVRSTTDLPIETDADTIAVGVFEDEGIAHDVDGALQALVDSGEARRAPRELGGTPPAGQRGVLVGPRRRQARARGGPRPPRRVRPRTRPRGRRRRRGAGPRAGGAHAVLGGAAP